MTLCRRGIIGFIIPVWYHLILDKTAKPFGTVQGIKVGDHCVIERPGNYRRCDVGRDICSGTNPENAVYNTLSRCCFPTGKPEHGTKGWVYE